MSEETKQPWDRTKWLLLIAVLMIVEGFVFYAAMENSNSTSALGYISFAGTVTSIILAVLAIIYGFVQSGLQEKKSEAISRQMERVRDVVNDLTKSKTDLGDEVDKLEHISNGINELLSSHSSISTSMEEIQKKLNFENLTPLTSPVDEKAFFNKIKVMHPVLFAIYYAVHSKGLSDYKDFENYVSDMFNKFTSQREERKNEKYMFLAGQFTVIIHFLNFLNKLEVNEAGKIKLDNDFIVLLDELFEVSQDDGLKKMKKVVEENDSSHSPS